MNFIFTRIRAAVTAFKDPCLVGEAQGMRETVHKLCRTDQFALLEGMWCGEHMSPKIIALPYDVQRAFKRFMES